MTLGVLMRLVQGGLIGALITAVATIVAAWITVGRESSPPPVGTPEPPPIVVSKPPDAAGLAVDQRTARGLPGIWKGSFIEKAVDLERVDRVFEATATIRMTRERELTGDVTFKLPKGNKVHDVKLDVRVERVRNRSVRLLFDNQNETGDHFGACVGTLNNIGDRVEGQYLSYGLDHDGSIATGTFVLDRQDDDADKATMPPG
jgi:hypothetical protein